MRTSNRDCSGCRYWSEMVAMVERGALKAMCLASSGPFASKYTTEHMSCTAFAKNTVGAIDDPPNYGDEVRPIYEKQAKATYPNGAPMYAVDGTMLDEMGNRSIFDDIDQ